MTAKDLKIILTIIDLIHIKEQLKTYYIDFNNPLHIKTMIQYLNHETNY